MRCGWKADRTRSIFSQGICGTDEEWHGAVSKRVKTMYFLFICDCYYYFVQIYIVLNITVHALISNLESLFTCLSNINLFTCRIIEGNPTASKKPPKSQKWVMRSKEGGGAVIPCTWEIIAENTDADWSLGC